MRKQDLGFDYHRYHRLLTEADNEDKRLALIDLLIEEKAKDRLAAQRASDRAAMTAQTIANVLKNGRYRDLALLTRGRVDAFGAVSPSLHAASSPSLSAAPSPVLPETSNRSSP
jgi:hypothetical protein